MTGPLADRRVLVVEDEMLLLLSIETLLEDLGCSNISAAASVAEALALLDVHTFDAALLDINLGVEKSYPIADALIRRGVPFAFSTGCDHHGDRADLAARPTLRKPYRPKDLTDVFEQLLPTEPKPLAA